MPHLLPGKGILKLSSQLRERLTLKRRKRSYGDEPDEQHEGDDVGLGGSAIKHPPMRIDIVHPHTYESGISDQTMVKNLQASPPMNYWLNDEDSDNGSDHTTHTIGGQFTPQRPAPQPIPPAKNNRFSREEWQGRADGALFGSHRRRLGKRLDDSPVLPKGVFLPTHSLSSISLSSSASSIDMRKRLDSGIGCHYSPTPRQERDDRGSMDLDIYQKCVNALNELLFATNAQIGEEVQALIRHYLNGQNSSPFMPVFAGIIDQSFADFSVAARSILAVADHVNSRSQFCTSKTPGISDGFVGSTDSLLTEIVNSYMGLAVTDTLDKPNRKNTLSRNLDPLSADSLEHLLRTYGINVVKYSKEQMRLFAMTGLTKYVTNQILLSTGIENDLIDKLDEAAEALALVMDQIDILDSLDGPNQGRRNTIDCEDVTALRLRAAQHRDNVDRIQLEARDSGYTRHIYESILAEIQSLN
ncbi:hypothetical protein GGH94_004776 [Coemansia aciculifera]|uniref:Uncharacterized protein n=1 Tax=Coemansia aciculifera TaxID=417176 RepID=A0A9W8IEP7_9FUNG|nr:hypothetical protein GGH94_004776 [Coemansia aciculifera]KAJ2871568.1 hypothetical protein GGH93_004723 [Coemansia aciculifera]